MADDRKPTHSLFYSKRREGKKDKLTEIGAAWAHNSGDGLSITVDVPLTLTADDHLVLFPRKEQQPG